MIKYCYQSKNFLFISRHANRDVVLAHVKGHYQDAGISLEDKINPIVQPPSSSSSPSLIPATIISHTSPDKTANLYGFLSAMSCLQLPNAASSANSNIKNHNNILQNFQQLSQQTQNEIEQQTIVQSPTTNENGEMDEASSRGTSVSAWRCPAPYRCGHCHQVSNWKHVIQVYY